MRRSRAPGRAARAGSLPERAIGWRTRGGQQTLDVHACGAWADAIAQRKFPSVLSDKSGRLDVPYYEADSVWAATGYGQFGDLRQRILTTEAHRGHS